MKIALCRPGGVMPIWQSVLERESAGRVFGVGLGKSMRFVVSDE